MSLLIDILAYCHHNLAVSAKIIGKANGVYIKKRVTHLSNALIFYVVPPGIEPGTPGFSVL